MTSYDIKRLALISAVNAEIEGMKARNIEREANGFAMAYDDLAFSNKANELREIIWAHDEQL